MKLSILNKKNNHKPNLQYANQGVILLLLVVRADDQWRKGGCSSFLKFWYAPLTRGGVMVVFSKMQPTVWSFGLCDCHFDINPSYGCVCFGFSPVWLLAPSLKYRDCFSVWRILKKVSFLCFRKIIFLRVLPLQKIPLQFIWQPYLMEYFVSFPFWRCMWI